MRRHCRDGTTGRLQWKRRDALRRKQPLGLNGNSWKALAHRLERARRVSVCPTRNERQSLPDKPKVVRTSHFEALAKFASTLGPWGQCSRELRSQRWLQRHTQRSRLQVGQESSEIAIQRFREQREKAWAPHRDKR